MATQKDIYAPRPLSTSIEYPGYQFYAVLRFEGHTASECLRYAALTVQGWLDGLEKSHDYLRGQGTYSRLQKILGNAIEKAKFQISLGYTVTSINYKEIREFVETEYTKGARKFSFFRYCGDNNADFLALNADQLRSATEEICKLPATFPDARFISEWASFYNFLISGNSCREGCNFLKGILTINYLGDIIVCAAINKKLGNIYRDEFCDLLEIIDREQKAMREIPETCIGCVHQKACHGGCKSESYSRYQNYLNRDLLCLLPYTQNEHWPGTSAK